MHKCENEEIKSGIAYIVCFRHLSCGRVMHTPSYKVLDSRILTSSAIVPSNAISTCHFFPMQMIVSSGS